MELEKLEDLGLSHNESLVYRTLLEIGQTKSGPIVKKTGLHRVIIYDVLDSLIRKGLASYVIKENIKYFSAENPQNLIDFLEEKKKLAKMLLPELNKIKKDSDSKQKVSIYEGIVGLKSAMNNMLNELSSKDYHYVFASGNMANTMGPYYNIYQKIKEKKKIFTKVIYDESFRKQKKVIGITYGDIRFFPLQPFPTDTWIYKDKVLIVTYTANPPIAILITSKETADSYKRLFEGYWKTAKK